MEYEHNVFSTKKGYAVGLMQVKRVSEKDSGHGSIISKMLYLHIRTEI
jgi:hypothetical protein